MRKDFGDDESSEIRAADEERKSSTKGTNRTSEELVTEMETLDRALIILLNRWLEEHYRLISLLSVLYQLLAKVIIKRLGNKFDFYQPVEYNDRFHKRLQTDRPHPNSAHTDRNKYGVKGPAPPLICRLQVNIRLSGNLGSIGSNARGHSRYKNLVKNIYEGASKRMKMPNFCLQEDTEK